MRVIAMVERGPPRHITSSDWGALNLEAPMSSLEANHVVRLYRGESGVLVVPGNHVGELCVSGATIRVAPKSPRLHQAMERLALRAKQLEIATTRSQTTDEEGPLPDVEGAFIRALRTCVADGIPWEYARREESTSFPRGHLNFGASLRRHWTRGAMHRVVTALSYRQQLVDFARVVRAAHSCLGRDPSRAPASYSDAFRLIEAFTWTEPFPAAEHAVEAARTLIERSGLLSLAARDLAARSLDLLLREDILGSRVWIVPGGVARFQNLERLWERCVQRLVACSPLAPPGTQTTFHGLTGLSLRLFADGGPVLDPDVVVARPPAVIAVADAKYKRLDDAQARAGDLYQLTAYVRRTNASVGALVHFDDEAEIAAAVGTTPEGAVIATFSLTPELLLMEGENALARLLERHGTALQRLSNGAADGVS
jgi:hypothetical protein